MRHRGTMIAGLVMALTVSTVAAGFAGTIPETLVEGGPGNQFSGDGNSDWFTWSTNSPERPRHYDARARLFAGKGSFKMNASGTVGYAGDINGETTEAVYQQVDGAGSDIYLYDLEARTREPAPGSVNTNLWEWSPSVSDGYILFGRNKFRRPSSPWKIMLYDRVAETAVALDSVTYECRCIFLGQVSDAYATWTKCLRDCHVWYHDIEAGTTHKVPNPLDKQQYNPGVSGASGDLFFIRSGNGCGQNVRIVRWNPVAGGDATVVGVLPQGYDVNSNVTVFDDTGGHQDVYLARYPCSGSFNANIYVVNDADTAAVARSARDGSASSAASKRPVMPGAAPGA